MEWRSPCFRVLLLAASVVAASGAPPPPGGKATHFLEAEPIHWPRGVDPDQWPAITEGVAVSEEGELRVWEQEEGHGSAWITASILIGAALVAVLLVLYWRSTSASKTPRSTRSDNEDENEDEEVEPFFPPWTINIALVGGYLLIGVLVLTTVEGWGLVLSFYVITQIVTTIGYGDVTVTTDGMRWFMTMYVFFGIALIANIISDVSSQLVKWETKKMRKMLRQAEKQAHGRAPADAAQDDHKVKDMNQLIASFMTLLFFVVTWALYFTFVEGCSCSYGFTKIQGCTRANCAEKGQNFNFARGIYSGVVTMTTVGFGDFTPKTMHGRLFGIVWMILGVFSFANFVTNLAHFIDGLRKEKERAQRMSADLFRHLDTNGNGTLSIAEFQSFFLLKQGIVTKSDLKHVQRVFTALDKDGTGGISLDEIESTFGQTALP